MSECNTLNVLIVEKAKTKKSLCFGAARALFSRAFARDNEEERKKGKTRALFFLSMAFSWERARVCFATVSAAFGKNKRDIPAGMSAGRTHNIDTKFGVEKRRGGMRRERERESAEGVCDLPRFLFFRCRVLTNERKGVDRISPPAVLI